MLLLPRRWFMKGSNHSTLQYCESVKYRQTVYVDQGYESKAPCGCSITNLTARGFLYNFCRNRSRQGQARLLHHQLGGRSPRGRVHRSKQHGWVSPLVGENSGCLSPGDKIKVGLETTGHYSYNILGFLLDNGMPPYGLNPLHTNLYRSLRKTKTDRVDARTIAAMLPNQYK